MKLLVKTVIIVYSFLLLSCIKEEASVSLSPFEQDVFDRINAYRQLNNLPEFKLSLPVQEQAEKHALAMANGDVPFSNDGLSDRALAIKTAIRGSEVVENIAKEISNSSEVVIFWRQDALSEAKMLGNFNLAGISSKQSQTGIYYHVLILFRAN
ncbi:MAG: CAP domain-containing protein [Okeania sp. SIO3C4]|nr:CAP domain-containing protein [Okeania sp. SIO3C4]